MSSTPFTLRSDMTKFQLCIHLTDVTFCFLLERMIQQWRLTSLPIRDF